MGTKMPSDLGMEQWALDGSKKCTELGERSYSPANKGVLSGSRSTWEGHAKQKSGPESGVPHVGS